MGSLSFGAKQVVENCLRIRKGEKVVIINDLGAEKIGKALISAIKKRTSYVRIFLMEDFGFRPEDGKDSLVFPEEISEALKTTDVSIYAASGKKNEIKSFREPMLKIINSNKIRHGHMIGITEQIMKEGMSSDYEAIKKISAKVFKIVQKANVIRVITDKGTDFTATFVRKGCKRLKWVISDGNIDEKNWKNLPDGEVFTCPRNINGKVIIDGCLGDHFKKYGDIEKTPVELILKNGRIVKDSLKCKNQKLLFELNEYIFRTDKNSNRIGEFAIGTNVGLKKIIGNLLQDEKFPGIHIAWGFPYPEKTGAPWTSDAHCDAVIRNTTILVDGKKIMDKGRYLI